MIVTRTGWQGTELVLRTDEAPLDWTPGSSFHWTVGDLVLDAPTPMYVFEPRPVAAVKDALETATTESTRQALEQELALCATPHVVYIAWHGILPKVGMTQANRLETRLREQGADAGFVVHEAEERAGARQVEQAIAFRYRIPEWRTWKETFPQWTRPISHDRIAARADDLGKRLHPDHDVGPLTWVDHPLPVLDARPHRVRAEGTHAGTVVGAKGNYLVYQPRPDPGRLAVGHAPLLALKRSDLDGRSVTLG